mgnify:FL=1
MDPQANIESTTDLYLNKFNQVTKKHKTMNQFGEICLMIP